MSFNELDSGTPVALDEPPRPLTRELTPGSPASPTPERTPARHALRAGDPWCDCGKPRETCVRSLVRSLFTPLAAPAPPIQD